MTHKAVGFDRPARLGCSSVYIIGVFVAYAPPDTVDNRRLALTAVSWGTAWPDAPAHATDCSH